MDNYQISKFLSILLHRGTVRKDVSKSEILTKSELVTALTLLHTEQRTIL